MKRAVVVGLALALVAASAGEAEAQKRKHRHDDDRGRSARTGAYFTVSGIGAEPRGELVGFFDQGYGAEFAGAGPVALGGLVRLRGHVGFLNYGLERQSYCFALPIGCRIGVDLTTANNIFFGGVGPELALTLGRLEPYAHWSAGFSYFVTTSSISGADDYGDDWGTTTHLSDFVTSRTAGMGVRIRLSDGRKPVSLDIGVEEHRNGVAEFLTEGDIVDHPDGSITLYPNLAEANLTAVKIGISIGIPRGRRR